MLKGSCPLDTHLKTPLLLCLVIVHTHVCVRMRGIARKLHVFQCLIVPCVIVPYPDNTLS